MLLLIDNYDSFTYNLVHYLGELGVDVVVERVDGQIAPPRIFDDGPYVHLVRYPVIAVSFVAQSHKVEIEPIYAQACRLQMICLFSLAIFLW